MNDTRPACIQVAGDPTVDWFLLNPTGVQLHESYQWEQQATVRIIPRPGGAALLTFALRPLLKSRAPDVRLVGLTLPDHVTFDPRGSSVSRSFQIWDLFPTEIGSAQATWRRRSFVGQEHGDERTPYAAGDESDCPVTCMLLDDTNLGFRSHEAAWPACLRGGEVPLPEQIILRMSNPLASGPLWDRLMELCPERLTVCFSAADLRKEYAAVGQALSWERSTSEVVKAVRERPELARVARVIVSIETDGAVIVDAGSGATLIFDPQNQEGDWEQRRPGELHGVGVCLVTALAYEAVRSPNNPAWSAAAKRGLLAARAVHANGYQLVDEHGNEGEGFPAAALGRAWSGEDRSDVYQTVPASADERWNMFEEAFPEGYAATARRIVLEGEEAACRQLPIERMGLWTSMDRTEIESMRSVRGIMREYVRDSRRARPLNLAVFGPPGSGKSFAIKQMARELTTGSNPIDVLEFNISQFSHLDEIPHSFQRVRDCAVAGRLPLVLWDEFDTALGGRELAWLASFLAPMQDGTFNDGGTSRPIGAAIFVFAGGTHATMSSFKARASELSGAKATDFLSRLRGFVDIVGPNPTDEADKTFVLRRASMLRAFLRLRAPQLFRGGSPSIDPGILNAFLHIDAYVHGARSLESLLDMSSLAGRLRYERSALPARHQLSLHVNADRFLALVREVPPA